MLAGILQQQLLEVGRARGENDFVALEHLVLAGERHIDKMLGGEQLREGILQIRLVAVPAHAKLLRRRLGHHLGGATAAACLSV